jgi:hypothetical protein
MKPYPKNLITVPACLKCNQSFQKDDVYMRTMLSLDVRASGNPDARSNLPAVLRSLQKPDAKGFVEYLVSRTSPTAILDMDGSPMGRAIEFDNARVSRAGQRIIRGLHFSQVGTSVPTGAIVKVAAQRDIKSSDAAPMMMARLMQILPDWKHGSVGTAFSYVAAIGSEYSVWLMMVYDFFFWMGTVEYKPRALYMRSV